MTYNPKKKRKTNKDIDYNNSSQLWDPGGQPRPQGLSLKKPPIFWREKPWGRGWVHPHQEFPPHPFFKEKALGTRLGVYRPVMAGSPNPSSISDQKMSSCTTVFRPGPMFP